MSDPTVDDVYRAALGAAAGAGAAEDATFRAFAALRGCDGETIAATAIRLALRADPAPQFAAMDRDDADAVALARLLRLDERRIAAQLGLELGEVRRRLGRGLRAVARPVALCA